jgi:hypothetical protein
MKLKCQQLWLAKNPGHFKGAANVHRVQHWRHAHPNYWRRQSTHPKSAPPLQESIPALQESIASNPLMLGLIAHIFGSTLQEDIERHIRQLIIKGMEIHKAAPTQLRHARTHLAPGTTEAMAAQSSSAPNPSPPAPPSGG